MGYWQAVDHSGEMAGDHVVVSSQERGREEHHVSTSLMAGHAAGPAVEPVSHLAALPGVPGCPMSIHRAVPTPMMSNSKDRITADCLDHAAHRAGPDNR